MNNKIKGYLTFMGLFQKIILFGIFPLAAAVIAYFLSPGLNFLTILMIIYALELVMELFFDFWLFGGVLSKEGGLPEFLKTSAKGKAFFLNGIVINMIRQFLWLVFAFILVVMIKFLFTGTWVRGDEIVNGMVLIFLCYAIITLSLIVTRCFSNFFVSYLLSNIGELIFMVGSVLCVSVKPISIPVILLLVVLAVFLTIRLISRKIVEGYYDKAD